MVNVSTRSNKISGSNGPKDPNKGHFLDTESIQKALQILTFVTTYAILMKRTADIHLNKVFHLAEFCGVSHREYKGANKKMIKMSQKSIFWPNLDHFLILQKTVAYLMHHLACHY